MTTVSSNSNKPLSTEELVKKELKINKFTELTKAQIIDFVSNVHKMPAEVAKACIEQFPNFKEFGNTALKHFYNLCDSGINSVHRETLDSYKKILDTIDIQLNNPNLSESDRSVLIDKMIDIGTKIEYVGDKRQSFIQEVVRYGTAALGVVVALGAGILGSTLGNKNKS